MADRAAVLALVDLGTARSVDAQTWDAAIVEVIARTKLSPPDDLAADVNAVTDPRGVEITLYLADLEQERLRALAEPRKPTPTPTPTPAPVPIAGTRAGHAFTSIEVERDGDRRFWVPMIDGSERLGVAEVVARSTRARRGADQRGGPLGDPVGTPVPR